VLPESRRKPMPVFRRSFFRIRFNHEDHGLQYVRDCYAGSWTRMNTNLIPSAFEDNMFYG
jgi:hypothetical protein